MRRVAQLGGSAPVVLGLRFAFERGAGRSTVPVRSALAALVFGVAGVASVLVFVSSLDRLVATPSRYGFPTELSIVDAGEAQVADLERDDRFDVVYAADVGEVAIDGEPLHAVGIEARKGELPWELLDGRPPATPDEIVLGTRVGDELDAGVGDAVTARLRDGSERGLSVVGVGVLPTFATARLGGNVAMTREGAREVMLAAPFGEAGASPAPGESLEALAEELGAQYELNTVELPEDVRNLDDLGGIPLALGAFLAALGLVALGHSTLVAARRRRRDVAMLRVLGFTPRETAVTFAVMSAAIGVAGAVVGAPLGAAIGSTVWRWIADGAAVRGDASVPVALIVLVVAAAIALSMALAVRPAWFAGRIRPADALRSE